MHRRFCISAFNLSRRSCRSGAGSRSWRSPLPIRHAVPSHSRQGCVQSQCHYVGDLRRFKRARAVVSLTHCNDELHNRTLNGLNAGAVNIIEDNAIHRRGGSRTGRTHFSSAMATTVCESAWTWSVRMQKLRTRLLKVAWRSEMIQGCAFTTLTCY